MGRRGEGGAGREQYFSGDIIKVGLSGAVVGRLRTKATEDNQNLVLGLEVTGGQIRDIIRSASGTAQPELTDTCGTVNLAPHKSPAMASCK